MKRRRKRPAVEYVTRDMLADLRDEIEEHFNRSSAAIERSERELRQSNKFIDNFYRIEARFEAAEKSVKEMKGLMGLENIPRHSPALHGPVTWAYFHSWISQINARIERLERKLDQ
jgi:hypothetical protein